MIGILILSPTGWNDGKLDFGKRNVRIMETQRYAYSNVTLRYALNGVSDKEIVDGLKGKDDSITRAVFRHVTVLSCRWIPTIHQI